jgi:membrane protein
LAASPSSTAADERPAAVGRAPAGPERLGLGEWRDVFSRAFKQFIADDCMGLAQQVAYSSLLAFFPAVAFLLGFLGMVHLYDKVQILLGTVAPHGVISFIEGLQKDSNGSASVAAFVIGLVGALWAASGAMGSIVKAVNRAYDRGETRPFWKVRLISIVLVVLSGLTTAAMFLLVIFGGPLGTAIARKAGLGGAWDWLWAIFRWPVAFAAILLFFALIYYLAPNVDVRSWKWITPGSLVGAVLWLALTALFALYASFSGSYSRTYGALASGVILLLWLNYTAWAILFGAELNSELDRQADIRAAGGAKAGLTRPARRAAS